MFDWIEKVYYPYIKKDPLCEKVLLIIQKKEKPFLFFMQIIANIVNIY